MEMKLVILFAVLNAACSSSVIIDPYISLEEIIALFGNNECIKGSLLSLQQTSSVPSVSATEENGIPEAMVEIENEEGMTTHQWDPSNQWEPSVLEFQNSKMGNFDNSDAGVEKSPPPPEESKTFVSEFGFKNAMNVVNELSNLMKIPAQYSLASVKGPPHKRTFNMNLKLGDEEYSAAGSSLKEAQHIAARTLLQNTRYQMPLQQLSKKIKFRNMNHEMKSPTSLVYEIGAKQKSPVNFEIEDVSGPPHRPTFTARCTLGNKITRGQGSSKKLAKRAAAENMLQQVDSLASPIVDSWGTRRSLKKSRSRRKKSKKRNLLKAFNKMLAEMQTRSSSAANLVSEFLGFSDSNYTYGKGFMQQMTKFAKGILNSDFHFSEKTASKPRNKEDYHQNNHNGDFNSPNSHSHKPKDTLMHVAHLLDFEIQFSDLLKGHNGDVLSLVSLSTKQPTLCYGHGSTAASAQDQAALRALKALSKMDPQIISSFQGTTKESASWKDWSRWVQDSLKEAQGVLKK